jgi:hypothetical protein
METQDIRIIIDIQDEIDKYLNKITNLIYIKIYLKLLEINKLFEDIKRIIISNNIYSI